MSHPIGKLARLKATDHLIDIILPKVSFRGTPPESAFCSQCRNVLRRPYQLSCGHRYCKNCIDQIDREKIEACPVDHEVIEYRFPDNSALTEVMYLECYCIYKIEGCQWDDIVLNLEDHVKECEFRSNLLCNWSFVKCDFVGSKREIDKHIIDDEPRHLYLFIMLIKNTMDQCRSVTGSLSLLKKDIKQVDTKLDFVSNSITDFHNSLMKTFDALDIKSLDKSNLDNFPGMSEFSYDADIAGSNKEPKKEVRLKIDQNTKILSYRDSLSSQVEVERLREHNIISLQNWCQSVLAQLEEYVKRTKFSVNIDEMIDKIRLQQAKLKDMLSTGPNVQSIFDSMKLLETKLSDLKVITDGHQKQLSDADLNMRLFQSTTYDGRYLWKLDSMTERMRGDINELFTPPLYTNLYGYKFCFKVLLFGEVEDQSTSNSNNYLSLYFLLMKGDFDNILKYPFPHPIEMRLRNLNKKPDVVQIIDPDDSLYFQKPFEDMNPAIGFSKFCSHQQLYTGGFVKDDAIYMEFNVDTKTPLC